jgi:hypothetical protein
MAKPQIVDSSEVKKTVRIAPATRLTDSLRQQGYLTAEDLAELFDVGIETIRRLGRKKNEDGSKRYKGPSKAARSGDLHVWGYTHEDVAELAEYFGQPVPRRRGKKKV